MTDKERIKELETQLEKCKRDCDTLNDLVVTLVSTLKNDRDLIDNIISILKRER